MEVRIRKTEVERKVFFQQKMNCTPNCHSCKKSWPKNLYTINSSDTTQCKSLVMPPLIPLNPFCNSTLFRPTWQNNIVIPQLSYVKPPLFSPLYGLNMKFGDGEPVTFQRAKIDFSVESLIMSSRKNQEKETPLLPSSTSTDAVIRSNVTNTIINTHSMKPVVKPCPGSPPPLMTNPIDKPASMKNRGRPSADSIHLLKQESLENPHRFQCSDCNRSFPRKKSLDTHRLTHSNVKPYACDFPGCNKKFKQSGQLKTHIRLHTGEKPFQCTYPLCVVSFAHANRKCPHHPEYPLQRVTTSVLSEDVLDRVMSIHRDEKIDTQRVKNWLQKQFTDRLKLENGLKCQISTNSPNRVALRAIENLSDGDMPQLTVSKPKLTISEDRRMLSAVALVELQTQSKHQNDVKLESLFSLSE